jgi:hypothetical protein
MKLHGMPEADFESGIGGFFVMPDNRVLARLPTMTPLWCMDARCSRGLSYHEPAEKHTYSILTVNSAGVPSEPSPQAAIP